MPFSSDIRVALLLVFIALVSSGHGHNINRRAATVMSEDKPENKPETKLLKNFEDFFSEGNWLNFGDKSEDEIEIPDSTVQTVQEAIVSDSIPDGVAMEKELPAHGGHEPHGGHGPAQNQEQQPSISNPPITQPDPAAIPNRGDSANPAFQLPNDSDIDPASLKENVRTERNIQFVTGQKIPLRSTMYPGLLNPSQTYSSSSRQPESNRPLQNQQQRPNYPNRGSPAAFNPGQPQRRPYPAPNAFKPHYSPFNMQKQQYHGQYNYRFPSSRPVYPWHSAQRRPMSVQTMQYLLQLQYLQRQQALQSSTSKAVVPNRHPAPNKVEGQLLQENKVPNVPNKKGAVAKV